MEKNKQNYLIIIFVFCLIIVGIGSFYLGRYFQDNAKEKVTKNNEEDNNINMVKEEVESLILSLNTFVDGKDSCFNLNILGAIPRYTTEKNYNLLSDIAGSIMECKYNGKYETKTGFISDYKVMDESEYNKFREYFNVVLEHEDNNYIAYNQNDAIDFNPCIYKLKDIIKEDTNYIAKIEIYEENNLISKGKIAVRIENNHIYYESFIINE